MRNLLRLAHLLFGVLLIFSLVFYVERVAFIDSSYHLFKLINAESLTFEASRYGAIFTKWPALLFIKLSAPLKAVMIIFSSWFIIWYYLIFLLVTYFLKRPIIGIAIALSLVVGYGNTFFHSVTETHQALVYCLLFYAVISSERFTSNVTKLALGTVVILISFLTHPISALLLTFLVGYYLIQNENYKDKSNYIYFAVFAIVVAVKILLTDDGSYEGKFFYIKDIQHSFGQRLGGIAFFVKNLFPLYIVPLILFISMGISFVKNKTPVSIYKIISPIILILMLVLLYKGGANIMKERAFLPFCTLVTLYFCEGILRETKGSIIQVGAFSMVSVIGLSIIFSYGLRHSKSIEQYRNSMNQEQRKVIVPSTNINANNNVITWSIPYETILISSLNGPDRSATVFAELNEDQLQKIDLNDPSVFLGAPFYLKHNANQFNKNYFEIDNCIYSRKPELFK